MILVADAVSSVPRGNEEEEEEEWEGGDGATTTTAGTTASARRRRDGAKAATPTARGDRDAPRSVPSRASSSSSSSAPKPRTLAVVVAVAVVAFATAAALLLPPGPGRERAASSDLPGASGPGAVVRADHGPHDVVSSSASSSSSRIGNFFDCDLPGSSCRYLRPGVFHRNYYHRLHDEQYDDHGEEEGYRIWRKHIGLDNDNLPPLDTLSWWAATDADVAQDEGGGYSPSVVPPPLPPSMWPATCHPAAAAT